MTTKFLNFPFDPQWPRVFIFFILMIPSALLGQAQTNAEITNVDFTVRNDSLFVKYDIDNSRKQERFTVSLKISTASGTQITLKSLTGDIGTNVTGGKNRQIIWNISKDNIVINEAVAVEVMAIPEGIDVKFVPRGKAALLSAVVPGLGLSKLNNGGPYWVMAIGVYGAAAGSILFYSLAGQNYTKYLDAKTVDERNRLHATVERQKTTADVLLATAGAIWLGNMIWTLASPNKTKKDYGVSFGGNYDPMEKTPVINILYKF